MKDKKRIGCCLGIILCVVGFVACVYKMAKFYTTLDCCFDELGDDYAVYIDYYSIVKITDRSPDRRMYGIDIIVPGKVENYNYDDNHIIVHQKYDKFYINAYFFSKDTLSMCKHDKDSIKANFEKLCKMKESYWIIYKKKGIIAGPFNKCDFDIKCKKEGIDLEFSLW